MKLTKKQEIWRPVKNYEGLYEVSNFGRVRSLTRKVKTSHQNIKHAVSNGLFNNQIILQFKNGKLVGAFHSTRDAAKATGLSYSAIGKCIQHNPERKHVGGCVFRRAMEIYGRSLNEEEE